MAETKYYKELDRLGVAYPKRTRKARKKDQEKKLKSCCEISFEWNIRTAAAAGSDRQIKSSDQSRIFAL